MRHRKAGLKLNRTSSHRNAMFRNMVTSLFKYDRIRTTDRKAKELRRWADNLITLAKRGDLHARRQAMSIIREKDVVHKLFGEAQERFGTRAGGYTRVVRLGRRPGDAAPVSLIELIIAEPDKKKQTRKKKTTEAQKKAAPAKQTGASEKKTEPPGAETKAAEQTEATVEDRKPAIQPEPQPEKREETDSDPKTEPGEKGTAE